MWFTKKYLISLVAIFILVVILASSLIFKDKYSADTTLRKENKGQEIEFAPGELLVKFKADAGQINTKGLDAVKGMKSEPLLKADAMTGTQGSKAIGIQTQAYVKLTLQEPETETKAVQQAEKAPSQMSGKLKESLVKRQRLETLAALERLKDNPGIEKVSLNYKRKTTWQPNDKYYQSSNLMWNLRSLPMEQTWDISKGENVVVAVIDTGVDVSHPDLAANIYKNISGRTIAQNFTTDDPKDITDRLGHGTHVAGIIAAAGNNTRGVIGMAPRAKIMPVKGLSDEGYGYDDWLINSIYYAYNNGAKIINMSWGGLGDSPFVEEALKNVADRGAILVASAGNDSADANNFSPAKSESVITVGASDSDKNLASFSNFGPKVDCVAPGQNILSTISKNSVLSEEIDSANIVDTIYAKLDGTSMAAPHVAGLAALMVSKNPTWSSADIKNAINKSSTDLGAAGVDDTFGFGLVNPLQSLTLVTPPTLSAAIMDDLPKTNKGQFTVSGTAAGSSFSSYEIGYRKIDRNATTNGTNTADNSYTKFFSSQTPVSNSTLSNVSLTPEKLEDGFYYFRLLAKSKDGATSRATKYTFVNRNAINGLPIENEFAQFEIDPIVAKLDGVNDSLISTTYTKIIAYSKEYQQSWVYSFAEDSVSGGGVRRAIDVKPIVFDINNDGQQEIIVRTTRNEIYALSSTGQKLWKTSLGGDSDYPAILEVADFNNDGKPEILTSDYRYNWDTYEVRAYNLIYLNALGKIQLRKDVKQANAKVSFNTISVACDDVDNDGKKEIALVTQYEIKTTTQNGSSWSVKHDLMLVDSSFNKRWTVTSSDLNPLSISMLKDTSVSTEPLVLAFSDQYVGNDKTEYRAYLVNKQGKSIKTILSKNLSYPADIRSFNSVTDPNTKKVTYRYTERFIVSEGSVKSRIHWTDSRKVELPGWPSLQHWSYTDRGANDYDNNKLPELLAISGSPYLLRNGKMISIAGGRYMGAETSGCATGDFNKNGRLECYTQGSSVSFIYQSFWPHLPGVYGWEF